MKKFFVSLVCFFMIAPVFCQKSSNTNLEQFSLTELSINQTKGFRPEFTISQKNKIPISLVSMNFQDDFGEETYEVYFQRYKTAKSLTTVGAVISITGFSLFGASLGWLMLEAISDNGSGNTDPQIKMMVSSYFLVSVGLPIWISQYQKAKNNKAAMKRVKPAQLGLGMTENGMGFVVSF